MTQNNITISTLKEYIGFIVSFNIKKSSRVVPYCRYPGFPYTTSLRPFFQMHYHNYKHWERVQLCNTRCCKPTNLIIHNRNVSYWLQESVLPAISLCQCSKRFKSLCDNGSKTSFTTKICEKKPMTMTKLSPFIIRFRSTSC